MKLVEVIRDTQNVSDRMFRYALGERLWLDDYTAHNLKIIGIVKIVKTKRVQ